MVNPYDKQYETNSITQQSMGASIGPPTFMPCCNIVAIAATRHNAQSKPFTGCWQEHGKIKISTFGTVMRKFVHLCFGLLKSRQPHQANYAFKMDFQCGIYPHTF